MNKIRKSKGFTLIELMIVVAIIGILAAVAIPKFADLVTKSKEAAAKGNLGAVRSAVSIYYGDMEGSYPSNLFTGLTTGDRYLPSQSGMGNFTIPSHNAGTGSNPGHLSNRTDASGVSEVDTSATAVTDGIGLYYVRISGDTFIRCGHRDTKGVVWTTY